MQKTKLKPAQILVLSFAGVILIGTILLWLPFSARAGRVPFLTALFTATSATCVTGLTVVDTGTYFSRWGQLIILLLMQIGGLGIMTLSTFFAAAVFRRRISLHNRVVVQDSIDSIKYENVLYLIQYVLIYTAVIEAVGAFLLFIDFFKYEGFNYLMALKYAIFHSVSAFCNAGFSLFSTSFERYNTSYLIIGTIMTLIVLGGLGFVVLEELRQALFTKKRVKFSLHTKLVLRVSFILIVVGAIALFFIESNGAMYGLNWMGKGVNSIFQSITARTAGFNTIRISRLTDVSLFLLIILMFIGASPGSTGGGIKTTTFAVLYYSVKSIIRGHKQVQVSGKAIPFSVVNRALAILFISLALVFVFTGLLLITESKKVFMDASHGTFIKILFEVVSAFGTVGLSTGITPQLSVAGRILIIIAMFMGRLGPLTITLALIDEDRVPIRYPEERVMVG